MAEQAKKSVLQQIQESPIAQALDKTLGVIDKFLGPSGKAWLANGLDEWRQVFVPGVQQIQAGNNPGLWGTITTGEATAERMAGDHEKQAVLHSTYDVPEPVKSEPARVTAQATVHGPKLEGSQSTLDKISGNVPVRETKAMEQERQKGHSHGLEM
jgi:hypothetical protein